MTTGGLPGAHRSGAPRPGRRPHRDVDADCTLFPGFDVRLTPGHTPGSSVVVLSSGTERAMLLGDMIHCPLELQDEEFNMIVDVDQDAANRVREAYARELEGSGVAVSAAHFPDCSSGGCCPGRACAASCSTAEPGVSAVAALARGDDVSAAALGGSDCANATPVLTHR